MFTDIQIFKSTAHRSNWEITSITFHHCVAVDLPSVTGRCGGKESERNESFGIQYHTFLKRSFKANASWDFRQAFCTLCLFACWLISRTSFHFKAFQLKYYQLPMPQNLMKKKKMEKKILVLRYPLFSLLLPCFISFHFREVQVLLRHL